MTHFNESSFQNISLCVFCSKRGRSRVWREACMLCFSPDDGATSWAEQSTAKDHYSINKVVYFTTVYFNCSGFISKCLPWVLIVTGSAFIVPGYVCFILTWKCCCYMFGFIRNVILFWCFVFFESKYSKKLFGSVTFLIQIPDLFM